MTYAPSQTNAPATLTGWDVRVESNAVILALRTETWRVDFALTVEQADDLAATLWPAAAQAGQLSGALS